MAVQQFNGSWVGNEDRLLLRFTTSEGEEYRLWLTRHLTRGMLDGGREFLRKLIEQAHGASQAEAIQEFREQAVRQSTDFSQAFAEGRSAPLGELPVLVTKVTFQARQEPHPNPEISVLVDLSNGKRLTIRLPVPALQSLLLLLDQLQEHAQWGLGAARTSVSSSPSEDSQDFSQRRGLH